jgi:hypothetical protein
MSPPSTPSAEQGGSSNGHYGGNAKTYMNVGLAMGRSDGATPTARSGSRVNEVVGSSQIISL